MWILPTKMFKVIFRNNQKYHNLLDQSNKFDSFNVFYNRNIYYFQFHLSILIESKNSPNEEKWDIFNSKEKFCMKIVFQFQRPFSNIVF